MTKNVYTYRVKVKHHKHWEVNANRMSHDSTIELNMAVDEALKEKCKEAEEMLKHKQKELTDEKQIWFEWVT